MILLNKFLYSLDAPQVCYCRWLEVIENKNIRLAFFDNGNITVSTFIVKKVNIKSFNLKKKIIYQWSTPKFMDFESHIYMYAALSGIKKLHIIHPELLKIIKNNGTYAKYKDIIVQN